ncbi:MAG: hypothetical protein II119_03915 [Bacilli bacterium]|nr:hypothetical protein [Bacilli bacterium]
MPEINDIMSQLQQFDWESFLSILRPIIITYITPKAYGIYRLYKDFVPAKINKASMPPELLPDTSKIDINRISVVPFRDSVIEFANLITEKFPQEYLMKFYNNISNVKINKKNFTIINFYTSPLSAEKFSGYYNPRRNLISINCNSTIVPIYHELFHMASTIYKNGNIYSGFSQSRRSNSMGDGINEGYTQLLSERYFGDIEGVKGTYPYITILVKELENIVGKEKMESLYFNANLLGLIEELKQYFSEEDISKLISGFDFILRHMNDKVMLPFEKEKLISSAKDTMELLFMGNIKKIKKEFPDELDPDFLMELNNYLHLDFALIPVEIFIGKERYKVMTIEKMQELLQATLNSIEISLKAKDDSKSK